MLGGVLVLISPHTMNLSHTAISQHDCETKAVMLQKAANYIILFAVRKAMDHCAECIERERPLTLHLEVLLQSWIMCNKIKSAIKCIISKAKSLIIDLSW